MREGGGAEGEEGRAEGQMEGEGGQRESGGCND